MPIFLFHYLRQQVEGEGESEGEYEGEGRVGKRAVE
jgi:hypothetical protein